MDYGLSKEVIANINTVFAHHSEIQQVILYGSRAKGNYKNGSDIDLTMRGKNLNLEHLTTISNELDELLLPYTIDLSIYQQIDNENLINHIDRVGIVFYSLVKIK